eukprot:3201128-Prymnesium_polylepis.1
MASSRKVVTIITLATAWSRRCTVLRLNRASSSREVSAILSVSQPIAEHHRVRQRAAAATRTRVEWLSTTSTPKWPMADVVARGGIGRLR